MPIEFSKTALPIVELPIVELPIVELPTAELPTAGRAMTHRSCATGPASASGPPAEAQTRLPRWLKRNLPPGGGLHFTAGLISELGLETVCESAKCPNRMECWSAKTATFMILGNVCTRPCGFCSVPKGKTEALEANEPQRVAEAAVRLGLKHVVITSVTRDDLADGGAEHFYQSVLAVRERTGATIEVLTPDFLDKPGAIERMVAAAPEVFNHNTETVPRLYRRVRGRKSDYRWTLELLRQVKRLDPSIKTKSGLMLGLGETHDELLDTLADLRAAGCDLLTLGQYLQPTPAHLPVERYVPPEEFDELGQLARLLGFKQVASGPFVRSSYHAREMAEG
ncbi:MAG TPA: lipoyl synthase [Pirellulales bacterium]|nr:lipoyl synthase [Pirellulales bacterium]